MIRTRKLFALLVFCMTMVFSLGSISASHLERIEASPDWVKKLSAAQNAKQLFILAGVGQTTAWISLHEKDGLGQWHQLMSTPGFIGKNGLGKTKEGDGKTPVGIFHFNKAFGIAPDPGCALPYTQVDENIYWSGDVRPGMKYNEMVDIRKFLGLDKEASEHIADYTVHYVYCLNISYNEEATPGDGSAIFLHCLAPMKPYTGGCVAIPQDKMRFVMQTVRPNCVVLIDSLKNISPALADDWGI